MKLRVMLVFIVLNLTLAPNSFGNEKPPCFALSFGTYNPAEMYPTDVAVDSEKNVYIVDELNRRIHKRDPDNNIIMMFGSKGEGDGQFRWPRGITLDNEGKIYVADGFANRVQKFDTDGSFLGKWGTSGTGDGEFNYPLGIAISPSNLLYVADSFNERIQVFDTDGNFVFSFNDPGITRPTYIAFDSKGNVWVTDIKSKVAKFDENGNLIMIFGSKGANPGQFNFPAGITVDINDYVYVYDRWNYRIQKFDQNGNFIMMWGQSGNDDGQLNGMGLASDSDSNIYIADYWNYRVQEFSPLGEFLNKWTGTVPGDGEFAYIHDLAVNHLGDVYVVDRYSQNVQVLDSLGNFLFKWGQRGHQESGFNFPRAIAVDADNNLYISNDNYINSFDKDGNYRYCWTFFNPEDAWVGPLGLTVDVSGNLFFTSTANEVIKTDENGNVITRWGTFGTGNGQFNYPTGIGADDFGNVYVCDAGNSRVQKFTNDGAFILSWGEYGNDDGQFIKPMGLAVDPENNIYVVDEGKNQIQKFAASGNFLSKWGQIGSGEGEFDHAKYIAIDDSGKNIYVTDRYNGRVQKFTYEPVDISLFPDVSTIPRGGSLSIEVTMTNKTSDWKVFNFASNITLPKGSLYPKYPELFYFQDGIVLPPFETSTEYVTHDIPIDAPLGTFIYNGYVGKGLQDIWNECHFDFTVTP